VGVVWNLYSSDKDGVSSADVPIIRADNKPFKAIPDDPGGEEISHRDSTVFSTLRGERGENADRIENLFDDEGDEEPLPRSQLFAGLNTEEDTNAIEALSDASAEPSPLDQPLNSGEQEVKAAEVVVETPQAETPEEAPKVEVKEEPKVEPKEEPVVDAEVEEVVQEALNALPTISVKPRVKPVPKEVTKAVVKQTPVKAPVQEPVKAKPIAVPAPKKIVADLNSVVADAANNVPTKLATTSLKSAVGGYFIQVGSVRGAAQANSEWVKIQSQHGVLAGMSHRVEAVDLGSKGVFHRIQAGPVSKERADAICGEIKKKTPGGCLVKKK